MAALSSLEELLEWDVAMKAQTATSREMARRLRMVAELLNDLEGLGLHIDEDDCGLCRVRVSLARALAGGE